MLLESQIEQLTIEADAILLQGSVEKVIAASMAVFYDQQAKQLSMAQTFSIVDARVIGYLNQFGGERIVGINATTRGEISLELSKGVSAGEGEAALARRIKKVFKRANKVRALTIARTETSMAANSVRAMAMQDSGVVKMKKWISTRDNRTRPTHRRLNGQKKKLREPFKIPYTSKKAMYPTGFADRKENINCRCVSVASVKRISSDALHTDSEKKDLAAYFALYDAEEKKVAEAFRDGFKAQEGAVLRMLAAVAK